MPLTSPIVLTKIVSTGNETFHPVKNLPDGRIFLAASVTDAAQPWSMKILHSKQTKSGIGVVDRHLVQCTRTVKGADNVYRTMVVNTTVELPQDAAFTTAIVGDTIGMTGGLWALTNERAALLLGFS